MIGDAAVGGNDCGAETDENYKFALFHNHMTINPFLEVSGYFNGRAISRIREIIFEEFAALSATACIYVYVGVRQKIRLGLHRTRQRDIRQIRYGCLLRRVGYASGNPFAEECRRKQAEHKASKRTSNRRTEG